jgi:hypothetical protein
MKKSVILGLVVLIALAAIGCTASLGSYQEDKKYALLTSEINHEKGDVAELESKIAADNTVSSAPGLLAQLAYKRDRITKLEAQKELIFWHYTTSTDISDEMSSCELAARTRANIAKREKMVLDRVRANINESDLVDSVGGYKVVVKNNYSQDVNYIICPKNGGDQTSVYLASGEKKIIYLLPGSYWVHYQPNGVEAGDPVALNVDGSIHYYSQEKCFGYIFASRTN